MQKKKKKLSLKSKHKNMKNTMATGIPQKSYKALLPLWFLKKRYNEINKLKIQQRKDWKDWKESWYWNKEKGKTILILFPMNSKKVADFIFGSI